MGENRCLFPLGREREPVASRPGSGSEYQSVIFPVTGHQVPPPLPPDHGNVCTPSASPSPRIHATTLSRS